jgi:hypothetical protein
MIPSTCNRSASRIPGWPTQVLPLRDRSIFWHRIWVDCGRPKSGAVAKSMRRSRAAYHYAVRRIKNDEEAIVRERIASNIVNDDCRNFWTEIKRIRCNKAGTSRVVDGRSDVNNIAKLFADKYRDLYSGVPYDPCEIRLEI